MKVMRIMTLLSLAGLLVGCAGEKIVGKNIGIDEISEFYYTYDNINYNAFYQRYHFYVEEGRHMFFHETRQVEDGYGPATEKDTVKSGTIELSDEQWEEFFGFLKEGTVRKREESLEDGDSGPWFYLYWKGDRSEYQEFSFASYEKRLAFEAFCEQLAESV